MDFEANLFLTQKSYTVSPINNTSLILELYFQLHILGNLYLFVLASGVIYFPVLSMQLKIIFMWCSIVLLHISCPGEVYSCNLLSEWMVMLVNFYFCSTLK